MSGYTSRFDWYSATFDGVDDRRVAASLSIALGTKVILGRGRLGYSVCETLERDDETLAQVYSGSSREGEVHVAVSGDACDRVVPLLRRLWPEHRVSRADSAIDFEHDFDHLDALALEFAEEHRLAYRLVTDSEGGATRYLGSPSSANMVRVYKKSEQLRKLYPDRADTVPDGIVRVELQARPNSKTKGLVASMSANDLWGLGEWTQRFAETFLGLESERVTTHFRKPADWSRSFHWLGVQYGPVVQRRIDAVGREQALAEMFEVMGLSDGSPPF